jgi:hypothetical protein
MYDEIRFKFTGVAPLIQHSSRLADPLDDATRALKAITSKKKKTDADLEEMARLEWQGGLVLSAAGRVCLAARQIEAMIYEAARSTRAGKDAQRAVYVEDDAELNFAGSKPGKFALDAAWESKNFSLRVPARVQQARVMRTRPIFSGWSTDRVVVKIDKSGFDIKALVDVVILAGEKIGVGDWRPRYGRFLAEVIK